MMFLAPFFALAAAFAAQTVSAAAVDPPIIFPNATFVWTAGSTQTVTWCVDYLVAAGVRSLIDML